MGLMGRRAGATLAVIAVAVGAAAVGVWRLNMDKEPVRRAITMADVMPAPALATPAPGVTYAVPAGAVIATPEGDAQAQWVGGYLAELFGNGAVAKPGADGPIRLTLVKDGPDEGYRLEVSADGIALSARTPAGLFYGVQTLRQLIPVGGALVVPGGEIVDEPRFAYRGVMLDVARHFFDVAEVKRYLDLSTMYKVNHLHLHLSDDQGWRIAINGWPRLTEYGGGTEVGDGPGGFYTQDEYREIVAYAAQRFVTVIPEIDLPGHTNAALASYPELTCDGVAPDRYTGIEVGFSALCPTKDITFRFLDDVFGQLAELTPGPYLHIGGDEAKTMSPDEYAAVVTRVQEMVVARGKVPMGWHELAGAKLNPSTVLQYWATTKDSPEVVEAAAAGNKVVLSPANRAYLDMKYDSDTRIGLSWAGSITVQEAAEWDPGRYLPGVDEAAVFGVESPLWTETVATVDDIEYLAFPRLAVLAELGWSPPSARVWTAVRERLGAQAPRWEQLGVDFFRSDEVPWVAGPEA